MPLEDPREMERDIERLDTDYDPPPREEDNDNGPLADNRLFTSNPHLCSIDGVTEEVMEEKDPDE